MFLLYVFILQEQEDKQEIVEQAKVVNITTLVAGFNGIKITLNMQKVKKIFYRYKDFPVAVFAVSGPFRSGKSFLLNLLVRYLYGLQLSQVQLIRETLEVLKQFILRFISFSTHKLQCLFVCQYC